MAKETVRVKKQFKNGIKLLPSDKGLISRTYKELK
jgi:hypothetical protein